MKLIRQGWRWVRRPEEALSVIERAGRVCYRSEERIGEGTAAPFVRRLIRQGHLSVIEHVTATVEFTTNRGVTHELVRHRLASFSQESTRYVNYGGREMEFIEPVWWASAAEAARERFLAALAAGEAAYRELLAAGWRPEQAREVLPHALKTVIVVTANLREWRHIFALRTGPRAHPQIRGLLLSCLQGFREAVPVVFDDLPPGEEPPAPG